MSSWSEVVLEVEARAASRCEYCRMHQALQGGTFHVEHITPSVHGGATTLENLAWSCPGCNLHKSDRSDATIPRVVRWFLFSTPAKTDGQSIFDGRDTI